METLLVGSIRFSSPTHGGRPCRTVATSTARLGGVTSVAVLALVVAGGWVGPVSAAEKTHADKLEDFRKACSTAGIELPGVLPDHDTCKGKDKTAKECGPGWTFIDEFTGGPEDGKPWTPAREMNAKQLVFDFQPGGNARLYQWHVDGKNTTCWYLDRGFNHPKCKAAAKAAGKDPECEDGNGTLCFNHNGQVCALDVDNDDVQKETKGARTRAIWADLRGANELKGGGSPQACWRCHVNGTVAPKKFFLDALKKAAKTRLLGIQNEFASHETNDYPGKHWVDPSAAWKATDVWVQSRKREPKPGCGGCHTKGFIQTGYRVKKGRGGVGQDDKGFDVIALGGSRYCRTIVYPAFHTSGAMVDESFEKSKEGSPQVVCRKFAGEMGCTAEQYNCGCDNNAGVCKGQNVGDACGKIGSADAKCFDKGAGGGACDCKVPCNNPTGACLNKGVGDACKTGTDDTDDGKCTAASGGACDCE